MCYSVTRLYSPTREMGAHSPLSEGEFHALIVRLERGENFDADKELMFTQEQFLLLERVSGAKLYTGLFDLGKVFV